MGVVIQGLFIAFSDVDALKFPFYFVAFGNQVILSDPMSNGYHKCGNQERSHYPSKTDTCTEHGYYLRIRCHSAGEENDGKKSKQGPQ